MSFIYTDNGFVNLDHVVSIDSPRGDRGGYLATLTNGKTTEVSIAFERELLLHGAAFLPATGDHVLHWCGEPTADNDTFDWWTETIIGWLVTVGSNPAPITMSGVPSATNPRLIEDKKTGKFQLDEYDGGWFDSREAYEKQWRRTHAVL